MITQNPVIGRGRKKLGGVYARTLYGKNIIQTCPGTQTFKPTKKLTATRNAFGLIMQMANLVDKSYLYNIYYSTPVGHSRRHELASQLFTAVHRDNETVSFDVQALAELGTNPVVTNAGLLYTIQSKEFTIPKSQFNITELADASRVPCIFAVSYELFLIVPLVDYTTMDEDNFNFANVSDSFLGHQVLLIPLWQTNVGTLINPVWQYGGFKLQP